MILHDLVAKTSDWIYSSLIHHENPVVKVPKMLKQLEDHLTAPSLATIQYQSWRVSKQRNRAAQYTFGYKKEIPKSQLSCAVSAICTLVFWITKVPVLEEVHNRFSLMNDFGISFAMLSSVKKINDLIDWEYLPVDSTIQGSTIWKTKLFCDLGMGYYWVQIDL